MLSNPPAIIAYLGVSVPAHCNDCDANMTDFIPDAQTLLTVVQIVPKGSPAPRTAWRAVGELGQEECESKKKFI